MASSVENIPPAAGVQKAAAVNKSDSAPRFVSDSHIRVALRAVTGEIAAQNPGHAVLVSGRLLGVGRPRKAPLRLLRYALGAGSVLSIQDPESLDSGKKPVPH